MLYAKKDNKQIRITADTQADYEARGFTILSFDKDKGKKIISKPKNVKDFEKENKKLIKEIASLKEQLAPKVETKAK